MEIKEEHTKFFASHCNGGRSHLWTSRWPLFQSGHTTVEHSHSGHMIVEHSQSGRMIVKLSQSGHTILEHSQSGHMIVEHSKGT